MKLSNDEFRTLVRVAPLVSIDLICRNEKNEILLLKRKDGPARGYYFTPGGRIDKGEAKASAATRILKDETALECDLDQSNFLGAFEHIYPDNKFDDPTFGTHYVALGYEVYIQDSNKIVVDQNHSDHKWLSEEEARTDETVHGYVKDYLDALLPKTDNEEFLVGAGIIYESLMHHYTHYDAQLWNRTQLIIAVQGAAAYASYDMNAMPKLIAAIQTFAAILTIAVSHLIRLDFYNSRVNQRAMDFISERVVNSNRLKRIRLRGSDSGWLSGYQVVQCVVRTFAAINLAVATYYLNF